MFGLCVFVCSYDMHVLFCVYAYMSVCVCCVCVCVCVCVCRDDYNSLTYDIFRPFYSMSDHLYHYLSDAMYGCPIKLKDNMAINGFCLIISKNL